MPHFHIACRTSRGEVLAVGAGESVAQAIVSFTEQLNVWRAKIGDDERADFSDVGLSGVVEFLLVKCELDVVDIEIGDDAENLSLFIVSAD